LATTGVALPLLVHVETKMKNIQLLAQKSLDLLAEVETYSFYKSQLKKSLRQLFNDYQQGRYRYFEYEREQKKLLKGRSEEEWIGYYNSYILSLLKRIEAYNSQIFYEAYQDTAYLGIKVVPRPRVVEVPPPPVAKPAEVRVERKVVEVPKPVAEVPVAVAKPAVPPVEEVEAVAVAPEVKLVEVRPSLVDRVSLFFRRMFARKEVEGRIEELKRPARPALGAPAPAVVRKRFFGLLLKKEKPMLGREAEEEGIPTAKARPAEEAEVAMGRIFGISYFRNLLARSRKVTFTEKAGEIPLSTIQLETLRRKAAPEIEAQIEKITATALTKEAKRIRAIMEKRRVLKIYQPSFFGAIANIVIKRISLFLLDNFPDFFKDLYHALRLANVSILSNTYVNMMVLGVLSGLFIGLFIFGIFFTSTALPVLQMVLRTILMSVLLGLAVFAGFYAYPYSKMKQRRRSINTNLPFAINHMGAVSASGVAPVKMFRLISESKEYGEVSSEVEKIVNYIEVFGYDILTALKAVAATTPSYQFKDFLEGMVSTTQTGGDIKSYLAQKADESMLNYKLDRQKYTETIATYSDIYTGILIAAPLFFVAALSLVSLLGGKIGGLGVTTVIVLGTYVFIPLMNVLFLAFLEMTQPEI
jgi:flagellar protein FlaJ